MHGSIGTAVRGRRRAGRQGDHLVGDAGGLSAERAAPRCCSACRPRTCASFSRWASGCYGINGADTVSYDAALLSQAVGKPVRVQLSRKDEMAWENYGFAFVIDQRAALERRRHHRRLGSRSRGRRRWAAGPAGTTRATSSPAFWPVSSRQAFTPRTPAPDPTGFANNSNAVPSYVTGCVGGRCGGTGTVAQPARPDAQRAVAVLHRTAAIAGAAAEHVRARIVHGRNRGAR